MNGQGKGYPLILLDAAVIMGIQIRNSAFFIQRILLHINPRAVNMRAQNIHAFLQRLPADLIHQQALIHVNRIYLITGFQLLAFRDQIGKFSVSFLLDQVNQRIHAFPFCFAIIQEIHIFSGKGVRCFTLLSGIHIPDILLFHTQSSPSVSFILEPKTGLRSSFALDTSSL